MTGDRPIALVTGAAKRVGAAIARRLARDGFDLIATWLTSDKDMRDTARECERLGATIHTHRLDLNDMHEVEAWATALASTLPRLDALIHNASQYHRTPFGRVTAEDALAHFRINALAPLLLTQAFRDRLRESNGSVVAFGDIHVMGRPRRSYGAYSMSKAALVELVRVLSRELAPDIRVNGVAPGVVAWPPDADEVEIREYESHIPLERPGTPEDAADAVAFLVERGAYITGEILRVDGGRFLAP
ncbi:MAG: SDR family oxidoreductase [Phycisphaerales bacterium]